MSNKVAVTNNVTKHVVEVTPDTASTTLVVSQQTVPNVVEFNAGLFLGTSDLSSINNLGDVNTSGISMGDILQYNGSEWVTVDVSIITGSQTLAGLNDVTITTASDGDFLRHNGVAWVDAVIQKADISDFSDLDYATALQGSTADSALQPGDIGVTVQGYDPNLVSDANYVATDENFTTADHSKLDGIAAGAEVNVNSDWGAVSGDAEILNKPTLGTAAATNSTDYATSAQGATADSALQPSDIGISVQGYNANTVVDANYVATDQNFTNADHTKLDGIQAGAEVNVNADWSAVTGDAQILNKPTLGTAAATDSTAYATSAQGLLADSALQPSDNISELINDSGYLTNLFASSIGQLSDVILTSPVAGGLLVEQAGGGFLKLGGSTWATNYLDLSNLKDVTITTPIDGQVLSYDLATSKWVNSSLATVATSGDYNDLINTPAGGNANVLDGQKVEYFTRSTAYVNGAYEGKILKFGTAALQTTKLYKYGASGWEASDANVAGKAEGLLGLALGTSEANDGLLVDGLITSSAFSAFSAGDTIYVSETEGTMTNTAPTAPGSIVRIVGYALGSSYVHFNPSDNFIELA